MVLKKYNWLFLIIILFRKNVGIYNGFCVLNKWSKKYIINCRCYLVDFLSYYSDIGENINGWY